MIICRRFNVARFVANFTIFKLLSRRWCCRTRCVNVAGKFTYDSVHRQLFLWRRSFRRSANNTTITQAEANKIKFVVRMLCLRYSYFDNRSNNVWLCEFSVPSNRFVCFESNCYLSFSEYIFFILEISCGRCTWNYSHEYRQCARCI